MYRGLILSCVLAFATTAHAGGQIPTIVFAPVSIDTPAVVVEDVSDSISPAKENKKLVAEIERLKKVISAKDKALDAAMQSLGSLLAPTSDITGYEYAEEVLGRVFVTKTGDTMNVVVQASVESTADSRFLGSVISKQRLPNDKISYTLDANKLKKKP